MPLKRRTPEEEAGRRKKLNLPCHFCTLAICENAVRPLATSATPKARKFSLRVRDELSPVWGITVNGDTVVLSDGGSSRKTSDFELTKQGLVLTSQGKSKFVTVKLTSNRSVQVLNEDLLAFLRKM